jgi:hypothetical protein
MRYFLLEKVVDFDTSLLNNTMPPTPHYYDQYDSFPGRTGSHASLTFLRALVGGIHYLLLR